MYMFLYLLKNQFLRLNIVHIQNLFLDKKKNTKSIHLIIFIFFWLEIISFNVQENI